MLFASNGSEALERAKEIIPDLILLDVMMPGMDGFEVCRRLRTNSILAEVPIILITALDDQDSRIQGINAGSDDFITKPFDRLEIRARIRTITRLNPIGGYTWKKDSESWQRNRFVYLKRNYIFFPLNS